MSETANGDTRVDPETGGDAPTPTADAANERAAELENHLRRALADLDNLRKRFDREVARERAAERSRAAALWLPVVDDLERALQHAEGETGPLVDGVRAVHQHAVRVLEQLGFPRFDAVGEPFDPRRHDALTTLPSDAPDGTVIATVRPGYGTDDEILRPAGVVVAKAEH
jgi:molecular chaperone GrpE